MDERMMHPTPSWLAWYQRNIARARAPSRVSVYTSVYRGEKHLPFVKFVMNDDPLPTPPFEWLKRLNIDQERWRAHVASDLSKDSMEYHQRFHNYPPVSLILPDSAGGEGDAGPVGRQPPDGYNAPAWGGWAACAVLVVLLVLIVRVTEKCFDRRLFGYTRRDSLEWDTPNVTATSLQQQSLDVSNLPHLDDSEFLTPNNHNPDLPPPYTECAPNKETKAQKLLHKLDTEETPPPYSACVVAFSNKDLPTVHIHREHTNEDPQTSSEIDNVQNGLIEDRQRMEVEANDYDEAMRLKLVFDNGRIVERSIDVESAESVPDVVARVGETVIGKALDDNVPCVDDNATSSQDKVIFV
ncbi:unnamed protein product [Arctia plantaginis]|uniref:Transmembrane protein n=1 Tax=Arctia plantaginis TaxID=874455 RepID=A0A8S0Z1K8_ARCPL|nr:unnamed protein product [Arctia plantaginis]